MEPNTAGAQQMGDTIIENSDAALRILYSRFPHPNIERMLDKRANYR